MKPSYILIIAASLMLSISPTALARLGETPEQCDARFGKAKFTTTKGDLSSRFYIFNGKQVQVVFHASESVVEVVGTGPHTFSTDQDAKQFTAESVQFFCGLVSKAYQFTDAQLQPLTKLRQTGPSAIHSEDTDNGKVAASCYFIVHEDQKMLKFSGMVAAMPAKSAGISDMERAMNFQVESLALSIKNNQQKQADGF